MDNSRICKSIVIAIPEQQHSFEVASSLQSSGYDIKYLTTVYFKENSIALKFLKMILPENTYKKAAKHHCNGIKDENVIILLPVLASIQLCIQRISTPMYRKFRKIKWRMFGKKVAKYVEENTPDVLILYEDYSSYTIENLKKFIPHIVIDCCAASKSYMKNIYELDDGGVNIPQFKAEYPVLWDEPENIAQFSKVDALLVPSSFSYRSYQYIGVDDNKIKTIGYPLPHAINMGHHHFHKSDGFKIVYSGQITYRKGLHHLLRAFTCVSEQYDVELYLYGSYEKDSELVKSYLKHSNIHFMGWTHKEKMLDDFSDADAFVFPSLADSMSFSCLEAMALGIPVICTSNTGAADYIVNYETGIIIDPSSDESIQEALIWCLNNRDKLVVIGQLGAQRVQGFIQKDKYTEALSTMIENIIAC